MNPEPFVDAKAVAEHLSITRRQALEMTRKGAIPGYALGCGTNRKIWRYKLSEVDTVVTDAARKKAPYGAFSANGISGTISGGSPRARREKSNG